MKTQLSGDAFKLRISGVSLRFVTKGHDGLIAWASCVLNGSIHLTNIAVRRGKDGQLFLTYPAKRTSYGATHNYFHPLNREAAAVLGDAILGQLRESSSKESAT